MRSSTNSLELNKTTNNVLAVTVAGFEPMATMISTKDTNAADKLILEYNSRACGLSRNDSRHMFFVSEKDFGLGFKSTTMLRLSSVAREAEVLLNEDESAGESLRCRVQALKERDVNEPVFEDLIYHATHTLAKYGIFLRDRNQTMVNAIVEQIMIQKRKPNTCGATPIGLEGYKGADKKDRNTATVGVGDDDLTKYMMEGKLHKQIKMGIEINKRKGIDILDMKELEGWKSIKPEGVAIAKCKEAVKCALERLQYDAAEPYSIYEWRSLDAGADYRNESEKWLWYTVTWDEEQLAREPNDYPKKKRLEHLTKYRLDLGRRQYMEVEGASFPSDYDILMAALNQDCPIFVFTDGGHKNSDRKEGARNSAAIVMCRPDIDAAKGESFATGQWQSREMIPILTRIKILPEHIGAHQTDNGHAEMMAMCMAEELLPENLPAIFITDSEVTMGRYRILRDGKIQSDRQLVRKILGGTSKGITNRLYQNIADWSNPTHIAFEKQQYEYNDIQPDYDPELEATHKPEEYDWLFDEDEMELYRQHLEEERVEEWDDLDIPIMNPKGITASKLRPDLASLPEELSEETLQRPLSQRMKDFFRLEEQWLSSEESNPWPEKYFDNHSHRACIKVDSHQTNDDGSKRSRYTNLTPNKAIVAGNQAADTAASIGIKTYPNSNFESIPTPADIHDLPSGLRFYLTYDTKAIDKSTPKRIEEATSSEMIIRSMRRGTQGLLQRINAGGATNLTPKNVGKQGMAARITSGRATTHSQRMHRNPEYALLHAMEIDGYTSEEQIDDVKNYKKQIQNDERYLECPFCRREYNKGDEMDTQQDGNVETTQEVNCNPKGDARHHHLFCQHEKIFDVRHTLLEELEKQLNNLTTYANDKAQEVGERTRLANRMVRQMKATEKKGYTGATGKRSPMNLTYMKRAHNETVISPQEWREIAASTEDEDLATRITNYPLAHNTGFIGAKDDGKLNLGEASVVDCLYMGYVPMDLQEDVISYAHKLASQASDKDLGKEIISELRKRWDAVVSLNYAKSECIAKATRQAINDYHDKLKAKYKKKETMDDEPEVRNIKPKRNNNRTNEDTGKQKKTSSTRVSTMDCRQQYCITSANAGKKPGRVKCPDDECAKCRAFHKHKSYVTAAEELMAAPANAHLRSKLVATYCLPASASDKQKRDGIESALYDIQAIKVIWPQNSTTDEKRKRRPIEIGQPISYIAKTWAINLTAGLYSGADGPINRETAKQLRMIASRTCRCNRNGKDTHTTPPTSAEIVVPQLCVSCGRTQPIPNPKKKNCKACNRPLDARQKETDEEACYECQILNLSNTNKMERRFQREVETAKNTPKQSISHQNAERILNMNSNAIDPRLIPVNRPGLTKDPWVEMFRDNGILLDEYDNPAEAKKEAIARAIEKIKREIRQSNNNDLEYLKNNSLRQTINTERKEGNNKGAEAIKLNAKRNRDEMQGEDSESNVPTSKKPRKTITVLGHQLKPDDLRTIISDQDMNDKCMDALLKLIAHEARTEVYAVSTYFYAKTVTEGWNETKKFFYSTDIEDQWMTRSSIPISAEALIIPIHTGETVIDRHWTALLRLRAQDETRYNFYYFDSLNSTVRNAAIRNILSSTPLFVPERGDTWEMVPCCRQELRECGPNTAVNITLALRYPMDRGLAAQQALRMVTNRNRKFRMWAEKSLDDAKVASMDWLTVETDDAIPMEIDTDEHMNLVMSGGGGGDAENTVSDEGKRATTKVDKANKKRTPGQIKQANPTGSNASNQQLVQPRGLKKKRKSKNSSKRNRSNKQYLQNQFQRPRNTR